MVFCLRFMMHGELSSCSSGHSGCCSPGFGEKESSKFRKSAGSPGVAVLALVKKSRASFGNHPRAESFDTQLTLPLTLTCTAEKRRGPRPVLRGQRGGVINFRE